MENVPDAKTRLEASISECLQPCMTLIGEYAII